MNTLHHYMTRITEVSGTSTIKKLTMVSSDAMFDLASTMQNDVKFEFKLLGVGIAKYRVASRMFHTQEQADSYSAGYYQRSMSATRPALDDFRDLGNFDADSDNEYREAAMYDNNQDY